MKFNVLIVSDEKPLRDITYFALRQSNFGCRQANNIESAYQEICRERPDIVLLDWMSSDPSGVDFIRMLYSREIYREIPIIMLTERNEIENKLAGFKAGCDDYITKPFSTRELVARIKAVLRRTHRDDQEETISIGTLTLDTGSHSVSLNNNEIRLGPTEYRLLKFFMTHAERVYSRAQLLDYVWGETTYIEERTVDVHIRRLRKALGDKSMANMIQTVRGAGYRLSKHSSKYSAA